MPLKRQPEAFYKSKDAPAGRLYRNFLNLRFQISNNKSLLAEAFITPCVMNRLLFLSLVGFVSFIVFWTVAASHHSHSFATTHSHTFDS